MKDINEEKNNFIQIKLISARENQKKYVNILYLLRKIVNISKNECS